MIIMEHIPFYEKSLFLPALIVSAAVHGLLIGGSGWISSMPYASVVNAPSSLEVTVVNQPVVTIVEEGIISEEIVESDKLGEFLIADRNQKSFQEAAQSAANDLMREKQEKAQAKLFDRLMKAQNVQIFENRIR